LNDVSGCSITISEIETLSLSGPLDGVTSGDELLVGVGNVAGVDLHQVAICSATVGNVETFVAEDVEGSAGQSP